MEKLLFIIFFQKFEKAKIIVRMNNNEWNYYDR